MNRLAILNNHFTPNHVSAPKSIGFVTLNNGMKMPQFGLGTYKMHNSDTVQAACTQLGYRMFDCASFYKNEEMVGRAFNQVIGKSVKREDMFVISKVWWDEVNDVEAACRRSLAKLGVDYLDLYLVHWPVAVEIIPPKNKGDTVKFKKMRLPM